MPASVAAVDPDELPAVRIRGLRKQYAGTTHLAVRDLSLDIERGQFVTLLGPSGCGKTSTLRILAGLEQADGGTVEFGRRTVVDAERGVDVRPDRRDLGMVFQSYAIWPNMTVAQNVAYPLKARRHPRAEISSRVQEALELVGMGGYGARPSPMLSGGQQQRVALARAIVTRPSLLLLDEPFSNLDAKLREQMRAETKSLQLQLGISVLFVTHDQTEALAMSDRIAIMRSGVIQQVGSPRELYDHPANEFVRDFVGRTLLLSAEVVDAPAEGEVAVRLTGSACVITARPGGEVAVGQTVLVGVRPEDLVVEGADPGTGTGATAIDATVVSAVYVGERVDYVVAIAGHGEVAVHGERRQNFPPGSGVRLRPTPGGHTVWPDPPHGGTERM